MFTPCNCFAELVSNATPCWQMEEFEVLVECSSCNTVLSVSSSILSVALCNISYCMCPVDLDL